MKKNVKIVLLIAMLFSMVIVLAGCGIKGNSKTYDFYANIVSRDEYILRIEGDLEIETGKKENGIVTIAEKAGNMFLATDCESQKASIINKDETTYVLMDSEKLYVETDRNREEEEENPFFDKDEMEKIKEADYTTGKEEIDGQEYDYEEYDTEDGGKIRYYFEGTDLKYVKETNNEEEVIMKILEATNQVDDSIFEVPVDYQEANY